MVKQKKQEIDNEVLVKMLSALTENFKAVAEGQRLANEAAADDRARNRHEFEEIRRREQEQQARTKQEFDDLRRREQEQLSLLREQSERIRELEKKGVEPKIQQTFSAPPVLQQSLPPVVPQKVITVPKITNPPVVQQPPVVIQQPNHPKISVPKIVNPPVPKIVNPPVIQPNPPFVNPPVVQQPAIIQQPKIVIPPPKITVPNFSKPKINPPVLNIVKELPKMDEDLAIAAQILMQTNDPTEYGRVSKQEDFDPRYFTLAGVGAKVPVGTPVYVKNMSLTAQGARYKTYWTNFLWNQLDERSKYNQRKQIARTAIIFDDYKARDPIREIMAGAGVSLTGSEKDTNPNKNVVTTSIAALIKALGPEAIPISQSSKLTLNSHTALYSDFQTIVSDKDLGKVGKRVMFSGLVTEYYFELPINWANSLRTEQEIKEVFRSAILRWTSFVLNQSGDNRKLSISILLQYIDYEGRGKAKNLSVLNEVRDNVMGTITKMPLEFSYISEMKQLESDVDETKLAQYAINPTVFTIRVFDPIRVGGAINKRVTDWFRECSQGKSLSKSYTTCSAGWGKLKDFPSSKNGCLFKILFEVLKENEIPITARTYKELWKQYDAETKSETFGNKIDFEQVAQIARWAKMRAMIYDENGIILFSDIEQTTPKIDILRLAWMDDHYFLVAQINESLSQPQPAFTEKKISEYTLDQLICYYDLETIYTHGKGEEHLVLPYSCAHIITDSEDNEITRKTVVDPNPDFLIFESMLADIFFIAEEQLAKYNRETIPPVNSPTKPFKDAFAAKDQKEMMEIAAANAAIVSKQNVAKKNAKREKTEPHAPSITIKMVAYNGGGFDHWILTRYLLRQNWKCLSPPAGSKAICVKFLIKSSNKGDNRGNIYLEMWDPYQFLHRSLSSAAKDFKLDIGKGDCNHKETQIAYDEGKLESYLTLNPVDDYVIRDVELVRNVTTLFRTACETGLGVDPFDYPTMANMGWTILTGMCNRREPGLLSPVAWNTILDTATNPAEAKNLTRKMQNYLRSGMIGGRVQGIKGIHQRPNNDPLYMVDVVSEYPYVMKTRRYPKGQPKLIFADHDGWRDEVLALYLNPDKIGMYYVSFNQRPLIERTGYTYLPVRIEGEPLHWNDDTAMNVQDQEGLLPFVSIRRLTNEGCNVSFMEPKDKDLPVAIVWESNPDTFTEYIEKCSKLKSDEDAKPVAERNNTMREIGKLSMNAVSGKASQRTFESSTAIYTEDQVEAARAIIKEGVDDEKPVEIILLAQNYMIVKKDKKKLKQYPVHLSCFIYAYARDLMWEDVYSRCKMFGGEVWYSDTDSAVINAAQLKDLEDRGRLWNSQGEKKFGMFEVEAVVPKIIVSGAKFYCLDYIDSKTNEIKEKLRIKGVRASDSFTLGGKILPVTGNGMKLLTEKAEGRDVTVNSFSIYRKDGKVMQRELIKVV